MGGRGSGSWYRWDSKTTTESQHRIDIRWLKKHGDTCGLVNDWNTGHGHSMVKKQDQSSIEWRMAA